MRNAREESMKSGIYLGKREIEIKEMPLPKVGENDVLIKNIFQASAGPIRPFIFMDQVPGTK